MIALRDYQIEAVQKSIESFKEGICRQLIVLPTGSGKTLVMAALAKELGLKTLLIAHRHELLEQAKDKFEMIWPDHGDMATFGSVQAYSRKKHLSHLKKEKFGLLLVDEAHHTSAPTYQRIIEELGFGGGRDKLLVGLTATAERSDKKQLGDSFDEIVYSASIAEMIGQGYLSPVIGRRIITKTSLSGVHSRMGDFAVNELSEAVNSPERNALVVESYLKYAKDRKGIAFCCDVQHCKDLATAFLEADVPAVAIYGEMDMEERFEALESLKNGEIQVATSCQILTEGFDEPTLSCIAMARPTKFKGLYTQCVGRGLRIYPSKENCLVLDFSDEGHSLKSVISLSKAIPEAHEVREIAKQPQTPEDGGRFITIRRELNEEFNLLGASTTRLIWINVEGSWSLLDDIQNEIVMTPKGSGFVATVYWKNGKESTLITQPLPLDYASGICEDFARKYFQLKFGALEMLRGASDTGPTPQQIECLKKAGIDAGNMNRAQASLKIRERITLQRMNQRKLQQEPLTDKQAFFLRHNGIACAGLSKMQGMKLISRLKSGVDA